MTDKEEILTRDGTVRVAVLGDGVLLKVRAHGADISGEDALAIAALLTRAAIDSQAAMVKRVLEENLKRLKALDLDEPEHD